MERIQTPSPGVLTEDNAWRRPIEFFRDKTVRKTTVVIPCHLGLHARCAAKIVPFMKGFRSEIHIRKDSTVEDGKSIIGLMSLGASYGTRLEVEIVGMDAEMAQAAIEAFFNESNYCADH